MAGIGCFGDVMVVEQGWDWIEEQGIHCESVASQIEKDNPVLQAFARGLKEKPRENATEIHKHFGEIVKEEPPRELWEQSRVERCLNLRMSEAEEESGHEETTNESEPVAEPEDQFEDELDDLLNM